jgi:hypothetical protein
MADQKHRVVLSGKLKEGADPKLAAALISSLLGVAMERVPRLLVGKRIAVRREMSLGQAEALKDRLARVGVLATVEPVTDLGLELASSQASASEEPSSAPDAATEPETGGLELEPPSTEPGPESAEAESEITEIEALPVGGLTNPDGKVRVVKPTPITSKTLQDDRDSEPEDGDNDPGHEQFFDPRMTSHWQDMRQDVEDASAPRRGKSPSRSKSKLPSPLLLGLSGIAVAALLGLGAFLLLGGEEEVQVIEASPLTQPEPAHRASPPEQRLAVVARAVKVWMIQFGVGYDPTQVTIERLKRDGVVDEARLEDAWGTEMRYEPGVEGFRVLSAGADRKFGTRDDLSLSGKL